MGKDLFLEIPPAGVFQGAQDQGKPFVCSFWCNNLLSQTLLCTS